MKRKRRNKQYLPALIIDRDMLPHLIAVLNNAQMHMDTWQDCDDMVWFAGLIKEISDVGVRLAFAHRGFSEPGEPGEQLVRVAGICLNWLRRLDDETHTT